MALALLAPCPDAHRQAPNGLFGGRPRCYGGPVLTDGEPGAPGGAGGPAVDATLMAAVARGDRDALAALYDRHADVVLALIQRIVRDGHLAEDLLHDVFLEAWHHAGAYDPGRGSVRTWLMIRARSRALDRRGKLARDAEVAVRAGREPGRTASAEADVIGIDGARLRRLAAGLDAELVRVIELGYFEGLSSTEMAEALQIPVGTVKSRMARALATLRAAFGGESEGA
jgi:RNA polymerase sigma-70 factor (ECF subfamily)